MATLGQQLKAAREAKNLTVKRVAEITRIKSQQIEGLDNDDHTSIPAQMYVKGFIKLYAQAVDLDPAPLLELYEESLQSGSPKRPDPAPVLKSRRGSPAPAASSSPKSQPLPGTRKKAAELLASARNRMEGVDLARLRAVGLPVAGGLVLLLVLVFSLRACARAGSGQDPSLSSPRLLEPTPFRIPIPESPE